MTGKLSILIEINFDDSSEETHLNVRGKKEVEHEGLTTESDLSPRDAFYHVMEAMQTWGSAAVEDQDRAIADKESSRN
jgi:hypothetical protein